MQGILQYARPQYGQETLLDSDNCAKASKLPLCTVQYGQGALLDNTNACNRVVDMALRL